MNVYKQTIDELAVICHERSREKGFREFETIAAQLLTDAEVTVDEMHWFNATVIQAEIARMHSELSEWLEAVRNQPSSGKTICDKHLPELPSQAVEAADCIIRILDTCGRYRLPIGQAVVQKLEYNASRPYKHGKNS